MTVDVIVVGILAILILGLAIYLWIDRKGWIETAKDAARTCEMIKESYKDLDSLAKALDEENTELTLKCNQYEALLKTRLDEIPVADIAFEPEAAYPSCRGEECRTCEVETCLSRLDDIPVSADECNQEKCDSGECCETCSSEGCPYKEKNDISFKKPCCACENGVYDPTECIGCTAANGYENYEPMKYE